MLDLFAGRLGWSKAFLERGWEVLAVDLVRAPTVPEDVEFQVRDVMGLSTNWIMAEGFDFICASPPCEQFLVHGMKHFHPNPPYPELGIKLFNHTRAICELSGVPFVIENVRAAQQFVGQAVNHCGPFYLWGTGVPPILPQGIGKGTVFCKPREWRRLHDPYFLTGSKRKSRDELQAKVATIPPELASCVADYAGRLLEMAHR